MTDSQRKGTVSELLAELYFVRHGVLVSKPVNDFSEYDIVADCNGTLKRIQVKTIYFATRKGRYVANVRTTHRCANGKWKQKTYDNSSCDILACVSEKHNAIYLIPIEKVKGKTEITLHPHEKPKHNQPYEQYKRRLYSVDTFCTEYNGGERNE